MNLRWGWRCVGCHHPKDAHWLHHGPCRICYCPRYAPPWWISVKNVIRRWWRERG